MIPLLIQRPSPVPFASLVLKKGSNKRLGMLAGNAHPVSQTETLNPRLPLFRPIDSRNRYSQTAAIGHGLHGVADDVQEYLLQLTGIALNFPLRLEALFQARRC